MKENQHPHVSNAKPNVGISAQKGILCVILNLLYVIAIESIYTLNIFYMLFSNFYSFI